jgi:bacterioferritin-associated ferredoxin
MCKGVRVSEAVDAARSGATSPEAMIEHFGFEDAECCGRCARDIESLVLLVTDELQKSLLRSQVRAAGKVRRNAISVPT